MESYRWGHHLQLSAERRAQDLSNHLSERCVAGNVAEHVQGDVHCVQIHAATCKRQLHSEADGCPPSQHTSNRNLHLYDDAGNYNNNNNNDSCRWYLHSRSNMVSFMSLPLTYAVY